MESFETGKKSTLLESFEAGKKSRSALLERFETGRCKKLENLRHVGAENDRVPGHVRPKMN